MAVTEWRNVDAAGADGATRLALRQISLIGRTLTGEINAMNASGVAALDDDAIDAVRVSGTLSPDATGLYWRRGTYNGKAYYERSSSGWRLWWRSSQLQWVVSLDLGASGADYWETTAAGDEDYQDVTMTAGGTATGTLTARNIVDLGRNEIRQNLNAVLALLQQLGG